MLYCRSKSLASCVCVCVCVRACVRACVCVRRRRPLNPWPLIQCHIMNRLGKERQKKNDACIVIYYLPRTEWNSNCGGGQQSIPLTLIHAPASPFTHTQTHIFSSFRRPADQKCTIIEFYIRGGPLISSWYVLLAGREYWKHTASKSLLAPAAYSWHEAQNSDSERALRVGPKQIASSLLKKGN